MYVLTVERLSKMSNSGQLPMVGSHFQLIISDNYMTNVLKTLSGPYSIEQAISLFGLTFELEIAVLINTI